MRTSDGSLLLLFPSSGTKRSKQWYFIDPLEDPNFALKVRERSPKDLDSALH